jgi:hypothetical protein
MNRYVVLSHDPDEKQVFWDAIMAESREDAQKVLEELRPDYAIFIQALDDVDAASIDRIVNRWHVSKFITHENVEKFREEYS